MVQGTNGPGNESSRERMVQGTNVPGNEWSRERKFHHGNECSRERIVLGTNIPDTRACGVLAYRELPFAANTHTLIGNKDIVLQQT